VCPTIYRFKYEIKSYDKVSIIIPNKNHIKDIRKCINSILDKTTYPDFEVIIIDNGSDDEKLFAYYEHLKEDKRFKVHSLDIKFNYSKLNNYATKFASGKYYILLNNDIEIITPEWIEEMLMYAQRDDVGAVGAKLYYPNDTIQHAGIILKLGEDRVAGHAFYEVPKNNAGYMGRLFYSQDMSAVTAACMMIKASVFHEVGGLDEKFVVAYNDVDLCLKIRRRGYLIVWTPYAEAYHYESQSRGSDQTSENIARFKNEVERFKKKWNKELESGDPYYNPNLTLDRGDFGGK
ncbi:MAG: glycosyltransferase family 2 protein, partial [Ruminococcus sp.]|nr:glycosyltransferase family 2 protein [Ruminococcus sp.]